MDQPRVPPAAGTVRRLGLLAAPFGVAVAGILSVYFDAGSPLEGTYRAIVLALILVLVVEAGLIPFIGRAYAAAAVTALVLATFKEKELLAGLVALSAALAVWSWLRGRHALVQSTLESVIPLATAALLIVTIGRGVADGALGLPTIGGAAHVVVGGSGRDIIVVMLDGYPRSDTLSAGFGLDNGPFLDALQQRGFDVAEESRSNYALTGLTLASMFQMRHIADIPSLAEETRYKEGYRAISRVLAEPLPAIETLRRHGYEAVAISSVVNELKLRTVDWDIDTGQMVQLETVLLGRTLIAPIVDFIAPDFVFDQQRSRSLDTLAAIESTATDERQQFVFAHVMLPHAPFVFGAGGEALPQPECVPVCSIFERPTDHDEWLRLYRDQVVFVNERVLQLIDGIRSGEADPVIVLMSDHGSRAFQPENQEEMLLNFFAAYTPGATGLFPDYATPINIFPRLFGAYLDEQIDLIPDRFFLPDGVGPLEIKAVE